MAALEGAIRFKIPAVAEEFTFREVTFSSALTPFVKLPITNNNPRRFALIFVAQSADRLTLSTIPDTPGLIDGGLIVPGFGTITLTIKDHATLPFQTWLVSGAATAGLTVFEIIQNP